MQVRIRTPAKINLFLHVLNCRPDGYHELISIVQLVSLYDTISISTTEETYECFVEGSPEISDGDNSVRKAVDAFRKTTGFDTGIRVILRKEIPIGGGLGGESTDAAATLKALRVLTADKVPRRKLLESAAALGSDVPLFMGSTASIITGTGDQVHPIDPRSDYRIVLIYPGFSVSTYEAYHWLDSQRSVSGIETDSKCPTDLGELEAMYRGDLAEWSFRNSFERIISEKYPPIVRAKKDLLGLGAVYAGITGSGSSIIGIFSDSINATTAFSTLKKHYPYVRVLAPLEKQIEPVLELA